MKKPYAIILIILLLIAFFFFVRFILGGSEDNWIKNEKGIWIKHGNPSETPKEVQTQQEAISCSSDLYRQKKSEGMNFSSQCLGICGDYAIDIVHAPRTEDDNKAENQCQSYKEGTSSHFIELDKNGEVVRVA